MTAFDVLCKQVERIYFQPDHFWVRDDKPGEAFARLPEEDKEVLRRLTSTDLAKVRLDVILPIIGYCESRGNWARDYRKRHVARL